MTIDERIKDVFADTFDVAPAKISEDMSIENTRDWDSMRSITLSFSLEEAFDVVFSDRELLEMDSYASIRRILLGKGIS